MLFRPARADELDAVAALVNSAYRGDTARRGWTHEADLLAGRRIDAASLRRILEGDRGAVLLVGTEEATPDRPAATVLLEAGADGVPHLGMLTVDPERQGRGTGRVLLREAEQEAARRGARRIRITVISVRSELIEWYRRRGYEPTGRAPFPHDDPSVGEAMRRDLEFVVMEKELSPGRAAPEA